MIKKLQTRKVNLRFIIAVFISVLLLQFSNKSFSQQKYESLFYMVDSPSSFKNFKENLDQISMVCPQTFRISNSGVITGDMDHRVIELAKANNIKIVPLIANITAGGFDQKQLSAIISDPVSRKRSIEMMLTYAKRYSLDGWQFDLESLHISNTSNFTLYFQEAADAFHKEGLEISIALVHTTENVGGPSEYHRFLYENARGGQDFKKLGEISDFITIMTYDQHNRRTTPGPVAGIRWMEDVVKYVLGEGVPPEKLSLGIPSYSRHWYAEYNEQIGGFSNAKGASVSDLLAQNNVTPVWDEEAGVNYAVWNNDGVFEYLFIEDERSLKVKLDLMKKYNLRGFSVWVLGGIKPEFWKMLKTEVVKK